MIDKIRFSSSSFFAFIITLTCFLGMSLLIANPPNHKHTEIEIKGFSYIKPVKPPKNPDPIKTIKKPVREVVKQPPAALKLDVSSEKAQLDFQVPSGLAAINPADFNNLNTSLLPGIGTNPHFTNGDRSLMALVLVNPIYPPKAIISKTEGWVTVEFTVNEFGQVVNPKVIDSKPKNIFNRAALKAISQSKFKPHMVDHKATSHVATQTFNFELD